MTGMLILDRLAVKLGSEPILEDVSATISPGQIVGLIGPNGAGKSTLLKAIAGFIPSGGSVTWGGRGIDRDELAFIPQNYSVQAELTVLETVLLGRHRALGWKVGEGLLKAAGQILCRFALVDFADRKMHTLSGGQQQLVLLAQRLLANPNLLLLDEATSALDIKHQLEVMRLLGEYVSETGGLVLLAVHDLNLASRYSDTIMLLHRGKLWGVGPFEVAVTPEALRAVYGIDAEFITSVTGGTVLVPRLPTDCQSPLVN